MRPIAPALRSLVLLLACFAPFAGAQEEKRVTDEYAKLLHETETINPVDAGMFGEEVSLANGTAEFSATDLSMPGNFALPVAVGRRLAVEDRSLGYLRGFGEWDLDVPYISGTVARDVGWLMADGTGNRCSNPGAPKGTTLFQPLTFWHGYSMHVPGAGTQSLLASIPGTTPNGPNGALTPLVTKQFWYISCLSATDNGYGGEAFLATAPDGTKYTFNHVVVKEANPVGDTGYWVGGVWYGAKYTLPRSTVYFVATQVEDRFGNKVFYNWSGSHLLSITTNADDRSITLNYDTSDHITSITGGGRSVNYAYDLPANSLTTVTMPDGAKWTYAISTSVNTRPFKIDHEFEQAVPHDYEGCMLDAPSGQTQIVVTHPSGAVGTFEFESVRQWRSYVTKNCLITTGTPGRYQYAPYADQLSLMYRTVTGPGLPTETRTYAYDSPFPMFGWQTNCLPGDTTFYCSGTKTTTVVDPDGTRTVYTFGNRFNVNEGQLLKQETGPAGAPVRTIVQAYVQNEEMPGQPFPDRMGYFMQGGADNFNTERMRPQKSTSTTLDGATFSSEIASFDAYANPTCVHKFTTGSASTGSPLSKYERTTYQYNTTRWVLSQVLKVELVPDCTANAVAIGNPIVESVYDYDPLTGLGTSNLLNFSRFGLLQQTYTYNGAQLASVTEPGKPSAALNNYYRGVPQNIALPDTKTLSATLNAFGEPLSVTDQLGYTTNYTYDAVGRLANTIYPTGDTTAWNSTLRAVARTTAAAYGLPANHWEHTTTTGTGRTTVFYDGHLRPVITLKEIVGNAASRSYVVKRYDQGGREVFSSYPVSTLGNYLTDNLAGTRTQYDAIGRPTRVEQDSELGVLATTTGYLSGFRTQVTNPRGKVTTTAFQTFDAPSTDSPTNITLPAGVSTLLARDTFGKPLTITRSGAYAGSTLSANRYFVYDTNQRLCKRLNPETTSTMTLAAEVIDYDITGDVTWRAEGQNLPSTTSCDRTSVAASSKITYGYDAMSRVLSQSTYAGPGSLVYTYFADGQVQSITSTNTGATTAVNNYTYNKRRLLASENIAQTNVNNWTASYTYDANGSVASMVYPATSTYPSGLSVAYAPNALGQPTQVGTFATGVQYWPNGAIKQFAYGNGIVHTMTPNARWLPGNSTDAYLGTKVIDDTYAYDADGNVGAITDGAQGGATSRAMYYDDLDRLTQVDSSATTMFGTATYTYDPLDNLRTSTLGTSGYTYAYSHAGTVLDSLTRSGGGQVYSYLTNAQGDITSDGRQAYVYDAVHRMTQVTGKENYRYDGLGRRTVSARTGSTSLWMYAKDGRMLLQHDTRSGTRTYNIYLGNTLVAESEGTLAGGAPIIRYIHTDALGSPVAKTDAGRNVVERTSYAPYGLPLTPVDGLGYTGHAMDIDTGLAYAQQRFYDPATGRFLAMDPEEVGGESATNFNRYAYALNNPYVFKDPDGRAPAGCARGTCDTFMGHHPAVRSVVNALQRLFNSDAFNQTVLNAGMMAVIATGPNEGNISAEFTEAEVAEESMEAAALGQAAIAQTRGLPITAAESTRIQNAANRTGAAVTLVGSRAAGTAKASSDWDYVVNANARTRNSIARSLPGAGNIKEGIRPKIDVFKGAVDTTKPHIEFRPTKS
jgi:RHS repeat-associated protein